MIRYPAGSFGPAEEKSDGGVSSPPVQQSQAATSSTPHIVLVNEKEIDEIDDIQAATFFSLEKYSFMEISHQLPIYYTPFVIKQFRSSMSRWSGNNPLMHPLMEIPRVLIDAFHEYDVNRLHAAVVANATRTCTLKIQDRPLMSLSDEENCLQLLKTLLDQCPDGMIKLNEPPQYVLVDRGQPNEDKDDLGQSRHTRLLDTCMVEDESATTRNSHSSYQRAIRCRFAFSGAVVASQLLATSKTIDSKGASGDATKLSEVSMEGVCYFFLHNAELQQQLVQMQSILNQEENAMTGPDVLSRLNLYHDLIDGIEVISAIIAVNEFHLPTVIEDSDLEKDDGEDNEEDNEKDSDEEEYSNEIEKDTIRNVVS